MYYPSDEQVETAARRFYEIYCDHSGWKNYLGLPCPKWSQGAEKGDPDKPLTEAIRGHWRGVARDAFDNGFRLPPAGTKPSAITHNGNAG